MPITRLRDPITHSRLARTGSRPRILGPIPYRTRNDAEHRPRAEQATAFLVFGLVRKGGFEPPRSCERQPLKLVRLPVPPLPHEVERVTCPSALPRRLIPLHPKPQALSRAASPVLAAVPESACRAAAIPVRARRE